MTFTSNWKPSRTARKKAQLATRVERRTKEDREKAKVRRRDKFCRFPLCGCRKLKLRLEVSHQEHKGIGGNPKGDRSTADLLILLCDHRHQYGAVSRHKGTMRTRALTTAGMNGPVAWDVDLNALRRRAGHLGKWMEVARETAVQKLELLTPYQREVLEQLAEMEL